jgi:iron transport multicopper oxidase
MCRNDPYKSMYDVDDATTVITLADWYHKPSTQHAPLDYPVRALPHARGPSLTRRQDSTLINGLGRTWANTTATPLAVVAVTATQRYRFRIVSLSCEPAFTFSIDGHALTIIEADGNAHQPYAADAVTVYAGQRYSVIVSANQPVGNYWIRALPVDDGLAFTDPFAKGINSAILRYAGALIAEPTRPYVPPTNELVEARLVPRSNPAAPGGLSPTAPDVVAFNLNFALNSAFQFTLNGAARTLPSVPTLLQIMNGVPAASLLPTGQYITLPKNSVVQLSFPGGGPAPTTHHPVHLHGHAFSVVRSAGQASYNFVDPPRRDVVNIGGAGDNVTVRFRTDNAGPWFLHCHVDWHLAAGFFNVLYVSLSPSARPL